jgi:hypothetical protein
MSKRKLSICGEPMTTLQTFYNFVLDSALQEVFRSLEISKESTDRFSSLWASYLKSTPPEKDYIQKFVQLNDFDDREKMMIGIFLLHTGVSSKIAMFKE